MAASINLTSSFPSGNQIPSNARDNVFCTGANDSPYLLWTLTDLDPVIQVESFRLICIDTDAAGSGPGGKFIHWKVEDIPPTIFSIGANQVWSVPVTIFPTDYPSGDNANGWHGPCPPSLHNYEIYIEAVIVPEQIQKVGVGVVQSNLFLFTDDPEVDIPHGEPSLDDCEGCPPGFTINPETGLCEQKTVVPADCSENLIPVCKGFMIPNNYGSQPAYFFEPVDLSNPANLPLVKTSGSYDLKYQDSTSLTQTASIPNGDPRHTAIWLNRLNEIGVWGPKSGSSTFPNCLPPELWADELTYPPASLAQMQPTNEWIGFTFCVEIPETKSYSIFAAGDNQVRWSVDGQLILNLSGSTSGVETYRASWIIEVTLTAGTHIFTLEGFNNGQVGAFGCEVYSAPVSDIANYASLAELEAVTVFSSFELVGTEVFDLGEESGCNCPEGYILSNCDGELECVQINQTPVSSCCYRIESCDNPGTFYLIKLDENIEQLPLEIGTVYKFSGNPLLTDQGCFQLIELTSCDGTELINIVVEETVGDTCEACTPCYELTDCSDSENTLVIQWDPNSPPLAENTAYVFDFAPDTCWTAELQFSPCEGTLYSPTNIVTTYIDCDECLKPCYKLIDCEAEGYPTISTENPVFEVYVGKVIQWQDQLGEDHCATVEKYICKDETWPAEPIVVLDCFDTCKECLPKPVPEPIFELSSRSVRPGYNTPGCPPEYYEKVKCKFSEAVYQEMLSKRFGIETCCDIDERKYDIKHELLKLDALEDPYLCNPICTTYSFSVYINAGDAVEVQYVDCDGVEQTISVINFEGIYAPEICALTTFTPVITITRVDSSVEQYKFETSYHICCPVVPSPWRSEACVFGFMDGVSWVNDKPEGPVTAHTITSLIINGTEYITPGNEYDYELEPTNWIPAANLFEQTYTNQVDGMNALFALLGVDNLVQVQVVTNDVWANTAVHVGGYYLILANTVDTISWVITDNTGYTKTNTWDNGVASVTIAERTPGSGSPATNVAQGYEWSTCLNGDNEPFIVTEGPEVIEPPFPPTPCCVEMPWTADEPNADGLFIKGLSSFYVQGYINGRPYYKTDIQGKFRVPYGQAYLWYDLSSSNWIISTSFGIVSTSLARLNSQEYCPTNFDIPTNSVTEPWVLPAESSFTSIITVDCQLEQNFDSSQAFQWHMYRRDDTEISIVQVDQVPGTHNGLRAWQFEEIGPYSQIPGGGIFWEISYNGVDAYEMRTISAIGNPYGGGTLIARSYNTNQFTITQTLSIFDNPVNGWEVVVGLPAYVLTKVYLKRCF